METSISKSTFRYIPSGAPTSYPGQSNCAIPAAAATAPVLHMHRAKYANQCCSNCPVSTSIDLPPSKNTTYPSPQARPMGFTTGLLSGFTLTASTLYLTVLIHNRHRLHQATLLHQQSLLLNSIVDPTLLPVHDDAPRYRIERGNWSERWKDGWNKEIESGVRWVHGIRWGTVREAIEGRWAGWKDGERRL